jgi:phage FluMu protein gp41
LESASSSDIKLSDKDGSALAYQGMTTGTHIADVSIKTVTTTASTNWTTPTTTGPSSASTVLNSGSQTTSENTPLEAITTTTNKVDTASLQAKLNNLFANVESESLGANNGVINVLRGGDLKIATTAVNSDSRQISVGGFNLSRDSLGLKEISNLSEDDLNNLMKMIDQADSKLYTAEASFTAYQSMAQAQNGAISSMLNTATESLDAKKANILSQSLSTQIGKKASIGNAASLASLRSMM